ncbi:MAG: acyl carrier protein [Thermodesulfobacteriota bacterium]
MNEQEIFTRMVNIIKPYVFGGGAKQNWSMETHIIDDLKVNSARLVDIIISLEDSFNITIADEEADRIETIGDAVALAKSKLN